MILVFIIKYEERQHKKIYIFLYAQNVSAIHCINKSDQQADRILKTYNLKRAVTLFKLSASFANLPELFATSSIDVLVCSIEAAVS